MSTSNEILDQILYNKNIRFAIYGGLYLFLFLFVGTVSFIKTYQNEKSIVLKRKRAFQRKPGEIITTPAPIELTNTDIQTIQQRKKKKPSSLPSPSISSIENKYSNVKTNINSVLTPVSTDNDQEETKYNSEAQIRTITIDEYDATNIDNKETNGFHSPIPLNIKNTKINNIDIDDEDEDDYHGTYSSFRHGSASQIDTETDININNNNNNNVKNNKKCFCNDFCYVICVTDFQTNWPKDTWRLRSIYTVIIVYLSDYITDLNILILWSAQAWQQYENNLSISDNGLNMIIMAIASCCILVFYKLISAFAVFKATGSCWYAVLQFLDLYIFVEVYKSHKSGHKTDRLRWLSNLESVFEASPQVILQLVYLIQTLDATDQNYNIVLLGLFFSVVKLGNTAINNDAVHVTKDANKVNQYKFWLRSMFRITEITAREFMFVLMWLVIGEKFLAMVFIINLTHNAFLYYGGCLSRQAFNIFGHLVALAQLSYTIVEGKPLNFFLRGKLHKNNPDYPNDTRSKLQFPYSIFIKRYLKAKDHQKQRRQADRKMRARNVRRQHNNKNKKNNKNNNKPKKLKAPLSPPSITSKRSKINSTSSINTSTKETDGSEILSISDDSRANMIKLETSVSVIKDKPIKNKPPNIKPPNIKPSKPPRSAGELHLNKIDDTEEMKLTEKIKLNEIEKYKTSIGDLDGIYSYVRYIHSIMVLYLNIYLSSQRPQQIMMIQRTILGLIWLLIIGIINDSNINKTSYWKSSYHKSISFFSTIILIMYIISILFTILSMVFFWLMMEREVINEIKKKEEIQFKTIYDAIYYGRLDAIINQFDSRQHLTSLSSDAKSALYYACELSQIDIVEWLISKKAVVNINIGANQNRTPLYISCRVGCYEIVKMLLSEPECKYNESTLLGRTPLYAACREGHHQIVCELLKQPLIDINALTNHNSCALAAACQHGFPDIVLELLTKPEIEINILNESNYTPIFIAALGTHSEIVKILLERPDIEIDKGARNDETLFYVSCERGMDEIVQILIDRQDYEVDINKPNGRNYTPLYIAACFGHDRIIEILMNIDKSTLNQCDKIGRTPFFVACRKGNASAVFKLLEYDDIDIHKKDQDELTPFAAACQGGSVKVVEKLMKLVDRSEIIGVDRMKRTPFFMACREGQTAVVERLMKEDNIIDINQPDKLARTPLMVCVKRAHDKCVDTLCKNKKIDINLPDHQERSPLFIAAKCGPSHSGPVKSLMSRSDLLINAKAQGGKTALHIACELGHSSIVMLLLDHNDIDVNEPDDNGTSPLAIADKKLDNNVYMRMVMISMRD